jgi:hypothetical protein
MENEFAQDQIDLLIEEVVDLQDVIYTLVERLDSLEHQSQNDDNRLRF